MQGAAGWAADGGAGWRGTREGGAAACLSTREPTTSVRCRRCWLLARAAGGRHALAAAGPFPARRPLSQLARLPQSAAAPTGHLIAPSLSRQFLYWAAERYPGAFLDVTVGSNNYNEILPAPCPYGYHAAPGWDAVSAAARRRRCRHRCPRAPCGPPVCAHTAPRPPSRLPQTTAFPRRSRGWACPTCRCCSAPPSTTCGARAAASARAGSERWGALARPGPAKAARLNVILRLTAVCISNALRYVCRGKPASGDGRRRGGDPTL